ncbi:MAG: GTP-binding protein Obg/CgtA [Candidatus Xenolissoclinum pacificiensis L6]|uniref:GTPase Obg n=1 Tax=Candidatus Xenolissoclinum pacificiensis L6 TaxID=1401685 RepID=W2UYX1_9RICK|nr:MAG: GTP-binding protein Obg/CgtA [Candidatus Xenolissoclinum pacificiensis L6]
MNFVDEVEIFLKAGDGGDGMSSFRREKFVEFGGPDGGNGGNGGDIIFKADHSINTLMFYRNHKNIHAVNGKNGAKARRTGESARPLYLKVPLGTQIINAENTVVADLLSKDDAFLACQGGHGGAGNACLKNSINKAPKESINGAPGEEGYFFLKLKVLADVGLLGLPNAGKSSFLASFSKAKPKIADYPFTTLTPNLGVVEIGDDGFVVADIPGLIKGAHQGLGLGIQFLKHLERCKMFVHIVDSSKHNLVAQYLEVRNELSVYNPDLLKRPEIVIFNKTDLVTNEEIQDKIHHFEEKTNIQVYQNSKIYKKNSILHIIKDILDSLKSDDTQEIYDPIS